MMRSSIGALWPGALLGHMPSTHKMSRPYCAVFRQKAGLITSTNMAVRMQNEIALTPLIYIKPPQRERSRLSEGAVLLGPYQIDMRGETHQSNYLKSIGREAPCFGMLSLVSRQSFL